jgi:HD-GYP domain-containing protein (c-di-GMP phosphodiesterase class II)
MFFANNGIKGEYAQLMNISIIILLGIIIILYIMQRRSKNISYALDSEIATVIRQETIQTMLKMLEKHDPYTKGHSQSVAELSSEFAGFIGVSNKKKKDIYMAALVHDIGKIFIPTSILNKPGKLTGSEFDLIKQHPVSAYNILLETSTMKNVAPYVKYHHEWYDGRGYPDHLRKEEIPVESRLLTIVDSWDAMTSDRIYKKGISEEDAMVVLKEHAGAQFDPILVEKWEKFLTTKRQQISVPSKLN